MKTVTVSPTYDRAPSRDLIAARAHDLWEANGRPADRDLEFWYEAERQLRTPASTAVPVTTARRGSTKKARDVDGLGAKTEEMLSHTGPTNSGSPTALDLGPR